MRRLRQWSRAFLVALMFAAGIAAVALVFPPLALFPDRAARQARGWIQVRWYAGLSAVLGIRTRVWGEPGGPGALWVSNHISWLDIVVLGAHCPLIFVAKAEVGEWPVVGFLARGTGTLLVRRGDAASSRRVAERMLHLLREQQSVVLFPEGTSTDGTVVQRFHARLFAPAGRVGARVQPIALAYVGAARSRVPFIGDDAFLPHLWRLLGERRIEVELHFCSPLEAASLERDRLAERARSDVIRALARNPGMYQPELARRTRA